MENKSVFEITLTGLAYGGDAIGRLPDGRTVFVPYALPGETVRLRMVEEKRSFGRGILVDILQPSPQRVEPRCPHFGLCGGCQYQHMSYEFQIEAKRQIVKEQLERLGGLTQVQVDPVVPSPSPWNYRNQVQFHLDDQGRLGYELHHSHRVVPIQVCFLPENVIDETWPQLQIESGTGLQRVTLRSGADEELLLLLESDGPEAPAMTVEEKELSVVHISPAGELVLAGSDYLVIEVKGRSFKVSAQSFFQVNTAQAAAMVDHILENLPLEPAATLLEIYSGVGLFSAFLAPRVGRLVAIESAPSSCQDFEENLDEFENVELYEAPAEDVLPALQIKPEAVLVDPPRAGLGPEVLAALWPLNPARLVYVSCDPATLARDARLLTANGYWLERITPFDLFPQTSHIETISLWNKKLDQGR